jgi:ABC-type nitrate/sulfonate/bicarbonate transport system substrate-binding protein
MLRLISFVVGTALLVFPDIVSGTQVALFADEPATQTPTYGFALTVNHVAVSVRYSDGSFEDLGRVEVSDEYSEMMKRLSKPEAQHPA